MFVCPNCSEAETTTCWGSDLEQGFECETCGYTEESHFGLDYDDGPGLSWKLTPVETEILPLSISEATMKALNLLRHDDESDDQLINRLLEHARAHMIIKGATPTE